jgi:hypothetical protein
MSANVVWLIGGARDRCGQTKKRFRMARRIIGQLPQALFHWSSLL